MKNLYCLFLLVVLGLSSQAQIINIPDPYLKAKLIQASPSNQIASNVTNGYAIPTTFVTIDTNGNEQVEQSEALQIKYLSLGSGFGSLITNLTGIEAFTNLEYLGFGATQVTSFSMPSLVNLISLRCPNSTLTSLDLTGLNALKILYCPNNQLTQVNLTNAPNLKGLNCSNNSFSEINLDYVPNLEALTCSNNLLTVLNFSNLPYLESCFVSNNLLENLDFSTNPNLVYLSCSNNPNLTSINIKNGAQQQLYDVNNNSIDCWADGNPLLTSICVDDSELADVQTLLTNCAPGNTIIVDSSCPLRNEVFGISDTISIYPNPTSAIVTINSQFKIQSVALYDTLGRVLLTQQVNESDFVMDVSNQNKGVYLLKVLTDRGSTTKKMVKE